MALPRFLMLKSNANNKYLGYTKEQGNYGMLRFNYEQIDVNDQQGITLPFLKFEVQKSATTAGLVHIRSCYNNKYFVRRSNKDEHIIASANEVEEDQSKWSCTLFQPMFEVTNLQDRFLFSQTIGLYHVSESCKRSLRICTETDAFGTAVRPYLACSSSAAVDNINATSSLVFTAVYVASVVLPDYATIMGPNGMYSSSKEDTWRNTRLSFRSIDVGGDDVCNKVIRTEENPQVISLWDRTGKKCWHSVDNGRYVVLSSSPLDMVQLPGGENKKIYFSPIVVGNYIALKCTESNTFLECNSDKGNALSATATSITDMSMLRVGEPVRSRKITNGVYDTAHSRIHAVTAIEMYTDTRSNKTGLPQEGLFQVKYTTQRSMKWSQSLTVNLGVTTGLSFGVPVIQTTLTVGMSYEKGRTAAWDEEVVETKEITYTQNIKIPAMKKVILKVVANRGLCNVPFACDVEDVLTDGTVVQYHKEDCIFYGSNDFQLNTEITLGELDPELPARARSSSIML